MKYFLLGIMTLMFCSGCTYDFMSSTPLYEGEYFVGITKEGKQTRFDDPNAVQKKHVKLDFMREDRINAWPLFYYNTPIFTVLWPLFEYNDIAMRLRPFYYQHDLDRTTCYTLAGVTGYYQAPQKTQMWFGPVFISSFVKNSYYINYLTPLFGISKEDGNVSHWGIPFYLYESKPKSTFFGAVAGLVGYDNNHLKQTHWGMPFYLYSKTHNKQDEYMFLTLAGLAGHYQKKQCATTWMIPPLYYSSTTGTLKKYSVLWPFSYLKNNVQDSSYNGYLLPLLIKSGHSYIIPPLLTYIRTEDKANPEDVPGVLSPVVGYLGTDSAFYAYYLTPLFSHWYGNHCTTFTFPFPFIKIMSLDSGYLPSSGRHAYHLFLFNYYDQFPVGHHFYQTGITFLDIGKMYKTNEHPELTPQNKSVEKKTTYSFLLGDIECISTDSPTISSKICKKNVLLYYDVTEYSQNKDKQTLDSKYEQNIFFLYRWNDRQSNHITENQTLSLYPLLSGYKKNILTKDQNKTMKININTVLNLLPSYEYQHVFNEKENISTSIKSDYFMLLKWIKYATEITPKDESQEISFLSKIIFHLTITQSRKTNTLNAFDFKILCALIGATFQNTTFSNYLFPLYYYTSDKYSSTFISLPYYQSKTKIEDREFFQNTTLSSYLFPLYYCTSDKYSSTFISLPYCQFKTKTGEKDLFNSCILFFLYNYENEKDSSNHSSRISHKVLWKLFHSEKRAHQFDLDLFPFISYSNNEERQSSHFNFLGGLLFSWQSTPKTTGAKILGLIPVWW